MLARPPDGLWSRSCRGVRTCGRHRALRAGRGWGRACRAAARGGAPAPYHRRRQPPTPRLRRRLRPSRAVPPGPGPPPGLSPGGPAGQPLQIQPGFPGLGSQQRCRPRRCSSSTCGFALWQCLPSAGGWGLMPEEMQVLAKGRHHGSVPQGHQPRTVGGTSPPTPRLRRRPRPSRAVPPGPGPHLPGLPPRGGAGWPASADSARFPGLGFPATVPAEKVQFVYLRFCSVAVSAFCRGLGPDARGNASPGQGRAPRSAPQGHKPPARANCSGPRGPRPPLPSRPTGQPCPAQGATPNHRTGGAPRPPLPSRPTGQPCPTQGASHARPRGALPVPHPTPAGAPAPGPAPFRKRLRPSRASAGA